MLDLFHLPQVPGRDVQVFIHTGVQGGTDGPWHTWTKPRGLTMAHFFLLGGGGGGGKGLAGVAASARGGGGGGGSGGQSSILIPLEFVPDRLFLMVGKGGVGGADPAVAQTAGSITQVNFHPENTLTNTMAQAFGGGAAANGTGAGNAAGGTAGSAATISNNMPMMGWGHAGLLLGGQAGSTGGSPTSAGTAIALPVTGLLCMGGTGGAGSTSSDFAGGTITTVANSFLSQYAPAAAAAGPNNHGSGPIQLWKPFFSYSGMGGGSSNAVDPSGRGGNGAYGSGGGGGAGGIGEGGLNSPGGQGGSGIIIISCW